MLSKRFMALVLAVAALGLVAAGCGDDEEPSSNGEPAVESSESGDSGAEGGDVTSLEEAEQALEDAPENLEEAVEQCKQGIEDSGIEGDAKDQALELCEFGGSSGQDAIENAEDLLDQLGE